MAELKILIKNNINILLGNLQGKKNRRANKVVIPVIILAIIGIMVIYAVQFWGMFSSFTEFGLSDLVMFHGITVMVTVLLIMSIMRVMDAKTSDAELLLSLPIRKINIVLSKIISRYVFDFVLCFLAIVPVVVVYFIFNPINLMLIVFTLVIMLIMPLISVGISNLCNFLVTRLFNNIRYGKILKSVFVTAIYVLVFVLIISKSFTYGTVTIDMLDTYFLDRPLSNIILQVMMHQDVINLMYLLGIALAIFVIGLLLYYANFGKSFQKHTNKSNLLKYDNGKGSFKLLYKKELSYFFTTPAYFINTIMGVIIMIILAIAVVVMGVDGINNLFGGMFAIQDFAIYVPMVLCFCIATCYISACSISLEGKSIWILKSLPIKERDVFSAKLFTHITIIQPPATLASIVLAIMLKATFIEFILILVLPIIFNLVFAVGGLLINLLLPKMEWEDAGAVVKQSASSLVAMLYGIIIAMLPLIINLIFKVEMLVSLWICLALYMVLLITFTIVLSTSGKKLFRRL